MSRIYFTEEEKKYISRYCKGRTAEHLTKLFNKKFNTNINVAKIRDFKTKHRLRSELRINGSKKRRLLNDKEMKYLRKIANGKSRKEITELINKKFNKNLLLSQVVTIMETNKIHNNVDTKFKKGIVNYPEVAFKKGVRSNPAGEFKKGVSNHSKYKIGDEIVRKNGEVYVKVTDYAGRNNGIKMYELKKNIVWKNHHGEIKKGYFVMHLDNDKSNNNIDNLILVSQKELVRLNSEFTLDKDKEKNLTKIAAAKLKAKIGSLKKEMEF